MFIIKITKQSSINNELKSIEIVIERAKLIGLPVILATSSDSSDDSLEYIARKHHIDIFRGELENKIKRWRDCFNKFQIDYAVQIDGDDLCYDFNLAKKALEEIHYDEYDIITCKKDVITGLFTFVLTRDSIEKLFSVAKEKSINTDIIIKFIEKAGLKIGFFLDGQLRPNTQKSFGYSNFRVDRQFVDNTLCLAPPNTQRLSI